MQKKIIIGAAVGVGLLAVVGLWPLLRGDLSGRIVIPYIAHQKPQIDPHLPHSVPLSDKLDEILFDGLFNISANASGIVYEDGLGEFIDIDEDNIVTVRLNTKKKWHSSFNVQADDDEVTVEEGTPVYFSAADLKFTLRRIQQLGSLSPDYILVSQALESFDFEGPDNNNEIRFQFKGDRIWTESDIKEVLSFKILPQNSELVAPNYYTGSGPYLAVSSEAEVTSYYKSPAGLANIPHVMLAPFVDNSTFTTELKNGNINLMLSTPFGSLSPILNDPEDFFTKSNISTTFFALLMNTGRLDLQQRQELRKFINNRLIIERFFKVNTEQQRHITDYKGNTDNYSDYLNYSVFPSSSYYVEEKIVVPVKPEGRAKMNLLPDSIKIVSCLNYGHREELAELLGILNDPQVGGGRIRALEVPNDALKGGDYDAVLVAIDGYKSTFLFDLYTIFLREPDLSKHQINLRTRKNEQGETVADPRSLQADNNFCRLDATGSGPDQEKILEFLENMYGFMYTNHIGDKQAYAQFVAENEHDLALGAWLFSMPSLAYFRTQFDANSIDLYGVASQLSTIEKWQEKKDD